jgi:phage host-nuclease inhibitor protein Gam
LPTEYIDNPSELSLEEAWSLVEEKAGSVSAKTRKGKTKSSTVELPKAPKRPLSSYLHFCAEKRSEVSATEKSLGSISKELARLWAETSDEARDPYVALAESGKSEYEEKKKEWLAECQVVLKKNGKSQPLKANGAKTSRAKFTSKTTPKRPKSAYIFFCSAKRADVSKEFNTLGEVSKELGRRWTATTASERNEYDEMAAEDKLRYEKEKLGAISPENPGRKQRPASKNKKASAKTKRGPSGYMLFCAAHRNDIVDDNGNKLPLGETTKRLAQMWKSCDDDTRARFLAEAEEQKVLL